MTTGEESPDMPDAAQPSLKLTGEAGTDAAGPTELRALCRIEDIPNGGTKGFPPAPGGFTGLFALRQGAVIRVYVNSCPHLGLPLDWMPDRFLSADGSRIVCATHGAEFRIDDGACVHGPCYGDRLEAVLIEVKNGILWVPRDAGL